MAKSFELTEKGDGVTEIRWGKEKGDGNINWPAEKGDDDSRNIPLRDRSAAKNTLRKADPELLETRQEEQRREKRMFEEQLDRIVEKGQDGQLVSKQERMLELEKQNPDLAIGEKGGNYEVQSGSGEIEHAKMEMPEINLTEGLSGKLDEGKGFSVEELEKALSKKEEEASAIKMMLERMRFKKEMNISDDIDKID